jgi:hypothetical protein
LAVLISLIWIKIIHALVRRELSVTNLAKLPVQSAPVTGAALWA